MKPYAITLAAAAVLAQQQEENYMMGPSRPQRRTPTKAERAEKEAIRASRKLERQRRKKGRR